MDISLIFFYAFNIVAVVLITDVAGAFGHWIMDSYGNPKTPIVGKYIFKPNIDHHANPDDLIKNNWAELISTSIIPVIIIVSMIWLIWEINWQVLLGSFILANANLIHKWCHCGKNQKPWIIAKLQELRILQTNEHHALHHLGNQDRNYAAFTNITNPILEYLDLWRRMEKIIYLLTSIPPENSIRIEEFNTAK